MVELGHQFAVSLAAMLLADQGAEVIHVETIAAPDPLRPDPLRPDPLRADALGAVLDRGKTCLPLDLSDPVDRAALFDLLRGADILVDGRDAAPAAGHSEAVPVLPRIEGLITLSIPGEAKGGCLLNGAEPYEGIVAAATGQYTDIHMARPFLQLDPVYTALPIASVYAGVHAATAAVLALRQRDAAEGSPALCIPLVNAALSAMSSLHLSIERQPARYAVPRLSPAFRRLAVPAMRALAHRGSQAQALLLKTARSSTPTFMSSYRCADGRWLYLFAMDNAKLTRAALAQLDLLDDFLRAGLVFADPYAAGDRRDNLAETSNLSPAWQRRLKRAIAGRLRTRPAAEWETLLTTAGVPCCMQRSTGEWLNIPELREAGIILEVDDPELGPMLQPGVQTWLSDMLPRPAKPRARTAGAPAWRAGPVSRLDATVAKAGGAVPGAWLAGMIVIDMCSMVAGPVAGRTLAEYGARVIKLEPPRPNHGPRLTSWYGVDSNQGKESLLLDVATPGGREVMTQLIQQADVLLTNHKVAAMAALGLSPADVAALNPELVYCRVGAYDGPAAGAWSARPGYDPVLQAASGIMMRFGNAECPELHAIASCVDALTGYSAAFGIALALRQRDRDGLGRTVGTSLATTATLVQLPFAFSYADRLWDEPSGQDAKGENPFYRLYRARDGWLFLARPGATVSDLPATLCPGAAAWTAADVVRGLETCLRRVSRARAIALFGEAGFAATPVRSIKELKPMLLGAVAGGLRLERRTMPELGPVVTAPAQQVQGLSGLRSLAPAEKPGSSTDRLLREFGYDPEPLVACGAAARQLSSDYLPG